jgi:hypothetical protein
MNIISKIAQLTLGKRIRENIDEGRSSLEPKTLDQIVEISQSINRENFISGIVMVNLRDPSTKSGFKTIGFCTGDAVEVHCMHTLITQSTKPIIDAIESGSERVTGQGADLAQAIADAIGGTIIGDAIVVGGDIDELVDVDGEPSEFDAERLDDCMCPNCVTRREIMASLTLKNGDR